MQSAPTHLSQSSTLHICFQCLNRSRLHSTYWSQLGFCIRIPGSSDRASCHPLTDLRRQCWERKRRRSTSRKRRRKASTAQSITHVTSLIQCNAHINSHVFHAQDSNLKTKPRECPWPSRRFITCVGHDYIIICPWKDVIAVCDIRMMTNHAKPMPREWIFLVREPRKSTSRMSDVYWFTQSWRIR